MRQKKQAQVVGEITQKIVLDRAQNKNGNPKGGQEAGGNDDRSQDLISHKFRRFRYIPTRRVTI